MAKDKDEKKAPPENPSDASAYIDPDKRRNVASTTRTRTSSESRTFDLAAIIGAVTTAHEKGQASASKTVDTLQHSLDAAHATIKAKDALIDEKNDKIDKLIGQLAKLAEANVTQQLLDGQARLNETKVHETHESIRTAIKSIGPAVAPIMARVTPLLLPALGDLADKGDKSPKACAIRVFAKLQDGSDVSQKLVEIIQEFAGDDWTGMLMFVAEMANAPPPKEKEA